MNRLEFRRVTELLIELPTWRCEEQRADVIKREFVFADFVQAFGFMTQLALIAEKRDHHPEWFNVYNRVDITLTTHDVNGISMREIDMVHVAERLYQVIVAA
ncbi:4a-hydroxytetrahydrobiopterin dehydratase [Variovorax paradoxus]|nr:4a-hydroxytetrahydrobiopterin dehydratase [Variovorax paradoxus]